MPMYNDILNYMCRECKVGCKHTEFLSLAITDIGWPMSKTVCIHLYYLFYLLSMVIIEVGSSYE
jgi:hypothetical protein